MSFEVSLIIDNRILSNINFKILAFRNSLFLKSKHREAKLIYPSIKSVLLET